MSNLVHVWPEVVPLEQTNASAPAEEPPADLDAMLDELDSVLARFDGLTTRQKEFPNVIANLDGKLKELEAQDLDTLQALEARSAQVGKLSNMKLLCDSHAKKTRVAIGSEQEAAIKLGERIATLLEQRWWNNYTRRAEEVRTEFDRLFYRSALDQNLQDAYKPITLLQWLRPPSFNVSRFSPPDTKIAKCRQLRQSANQLAEFEKMSFAQIADRVEEIDRKSRERLIVPNT